MSNSQSTTIAEKWVVEYTKYFTRISTNKDPKYIENYVRKRALDLPAAYQSDKDRNVNQGFGDWVEGRAVEYARLNEYYERFGDRPDVVVKGTGGRYLP